MQSKDSLNNQITKTEMHLGLSHKKGHSKTPQTPPVLVSSFLSVFFMFFPFNFIFPYSRKHSCWYNLDFKYYNFYRGRIYLESQFPETKNQFFSSDEFNAYQCGKHLRSYTNLEDFRKQYGWDIAPTGLRGHLGKYFHWCHSQHREISFNANGCYTEKNATQCGYIF